MTKSKSNRKVKYNPATPNEKAPYYLWEATQKGGYDEDSQGEIL